MSNKTIIGLTGNIATGKSVVRRMLEHLGAYGIDADTLGHRAISKGAPGFQPVVDQFGKYVLDGNGEIDRGKLGKLVFEDPGALEKLEAIVHPLVRQGVEHLIANASQRVVVVEAIKLLESPIRDKVDQIWVVTAAEGEQVHRLANKRGMSRADAQARMKNQSPQAEKAVQADTIIDNDGSVEDTWEQVHAAWKKLFPEEQTQPAMKAVKPSTVEQTADAPEELAGAGFLVMRAGPKQAEEIAEFITRLSGGKRKLTRADVMAEFGEKAFMILRANTKLVGLVGYQVENLVTRTDDLLLEPFLSPKDALNVLMNEVEDASRQLQVEAVLAFVSEEHANHADVWAELGYEERAPESLNVSAWQEAARESMPKGSTMLFKQLRIDRVLRPM